jgi:hypothetical protein
MKKLSIVSIMLVMCLVMSSVALGAEGKVKKCTFPPKTIVILFNYETGGVVPLKLAGTTTITVLSETEQYYRFSAEYDKPLFLCEVHGIDTYEIYAPSVPERFMDSFFIRKTSATSCE